MGCLLSKHASKALPYPRVPPGTPVRRIYPARGLMLLPNEMLLEVTHYLTTTKDVYALLLVNWRLSRLLPHVLSAMLLHDYNTYTPRSIFSNPHSLSLILRLLSLGIDLDAMVCNCYNPARPYCRCGPPLHHAIFDTNASMVATLLNHGASITTRCHATGNNAIHYAIDTTEHRSGYYQIARTDDLAILTMLLSEQRVHRMNDPAALSANGQTWLNMAVRKCARKYMTLVMPFLVPGLDVNVADENMVTPLHMAVYRGRPDITQALLERGAEHRTFDVRGESPWTTACNRPNCELIDMLLSHDAGLIRVPVNDNGEMAEACVRRSLGSIAGSDDPEHGYYPTELWNRTKLLEKLASLSESVVGESSTSAGHTTPTIQSSSAIV